MDAWRYGIYLLVFTFDISLVRYWCEHSKINSISPHVHVLFSISFAAVSEDYLTPLVGRWLTVFSSLFLVVFLLFATLYVDCGDSSPVTWASRWWGSLGQECWRIKPLHRKLHNFIRLNPVPINKLKPFQMDDLQKEKNKAYNTSLYRLSNISSDGLVRRIW